MKLPTDFVPEKNLEKNIQKLMQTPKKKKPKIKYEPKTVENLLERCDEFVEDRRVWPNFSNAYNLAYEEYSEGLDYTKKDIEEIKGYYNSTQIQIGGLEQKLEQTNNNYFNFYEIVTKNYKISLTINIAIGLTLLGLEAFSLFYLKNEIFIFLISSILKRRKANKKAEKKENE